MTKLDNQAQIGSRLGSILEEEFPEGEDAERMLEEEVNRALEQEEGQQKRAKREQAALAASDEAGAPGPTGRESGSTHSPSRSKPSEGGSKRAAMKERSHERELGLFDALNEFNEKELTQLVVSAIVAKARLPEETSEELKKMVLRQAKWHRQWT